jgi:hypothetical protein
MKPEVFLADLNLHALEWLKSSGLNIRCALVDEPWSYHEGDNTYLWEPHQPWPDLPSYPQVFSDRHPFMSGLSVIDLLMNKGPRASDYIASAANIQAV